MQLYPTGSDAMLLTLAQEAVPEGSGPGTIIIWVVGIIVVLLVFGVLGLITNGQTQVPRSVTALFLFRGDGPLDLTFRTATTQQVRLIPRNQPRNCSDDRPWKRSIPTTSCWPDSCAYSEPVLSRLSKTAS